MNTLRRLMTDPENRAALPLFITGAVIGVANYYVRPVITATVQRLASLAVRGRE